MGHVVAGVVIYLNSHSHSHLHKRKAQCLLVLQKPMLVRFCALVWVLFRVSSIFFFFLCVCITSFRDCTRPKHQKTTPESLRGESAKKYGKIPFNQKEKKEKKRKDKFSHETRFFCHKTTEVNICEIYTILWTTVRLRPYQ